jgi:hypothetical protein
MNLFHYKHREDWGHDYYLTLFQVGRWALIQSCFYTAVYGRKYPYLNITLGSGRLIHISFSWFIFGFSIEFISRSWF